MKLKSICFHCFVFVIFNGLAYGQEKKPIGPVAPPSVSSQTVEGVELQDISLEEAKRLFDEGNAVFLDTRARTAYSTKHIKGAINCSLGDFDQAVGTLTKKFQSSTILVVYCNGESCSLARKVGMRLAELGHRNIRIFTGGWVSWVQSGYPVEP